MAHPFNWTSVVNLIGTANSLFLIVIILGFKKRNRGANKFLAMLLMSLAVIIFGSYLSQTGYFISHPHLMLIGSLTFFVMGPLLYWYVRALIDEDFLWRKKEWRHLLPLGVYILYMLPAFYLKSAEFKIRKLQAYPPSFSLIGPKVAVLVQFLIYLLVIHRLVRRHGQRIKENYSTLARLKLIWIFYLSLAYMSVMAGNIFAVIISAHTLPWLQNPGIIWEAVLSFILGYRGMIQPEVFTRVEPEENKLKFKQFELTREREDEYLQKLVDAMERHKLFLDSELTLPTLADKVNVPPAYLSRVINRRLKRNFFDFVNAYRIEEAKQHLQLPREKNGTILDIAYQVGFNSKSTFNAVFKKFTGLTPSQYQRQI